MTFRHFAIKESLIFGLLLFIQMTAFSQNNIQGKVVGKESAISFANTILYNAIDSSFVKGNLSDENGQYTFNNIKDGSYYVTGSVMGFTMSLLKYLN